MHEFGPLCTYFFVTPDFGDGVAVEVRKKAWTENGAGEGLSSSKHRSCTRLAVSTALSVLLLRRRGYGFGIRRVQAAANAGAV
jgi:hypothetical protein